MSDWEESSSEAESSEPQAKGKAAPVKLPPKKKWEGEDEEEEEVASDWEESSEEEEKSSAPAPVAAPKKKGTLKAKIAEKEAAKAAKKANGDDDEYDSDVVLDPREKIRRDREREMQADLDNAASLFGSNSTGGSSSLDALIKSNPKTKEDFIALSDQIIATIFTRLEAKPLYSVFIEHHARALASPLRDVEIRKVASGLTTLANEKQKEARDKASGKKKPKAAAKPILGTAKSGKTDTRVYDEALDDFGTHPDDFM